MAIIGKNKKYKWEFENIGGSSRVKIKSGKDGHNGCKILVKQISSIR